MERELLEKRLNDLMAPWTFPGADASALMPVLEQGACAWFAPGRELCTEGDLGNTMYFLFVGSSEVLKKDRFGKNQLLTTIEGPALMGHMSLLDRSPRSATCIIKERAYVGVISEAIFNRFREDQGPSGTVFRRLILASLSRQLKNGDGCLQDLIYPEEPVTEELTESVLRSTVGVLEGWSQSKEEAEAKQWKILAARRARNLPLESGVTLEVKMDDEIPFTLTMHDLSPGTSERVAQRFIRFLYTIPTPPSVEFVYVRCTSSLLQRPQQVSKQLNFYFPRNGYQILGDEEKVTVTFPLADPRW